jgi:SAM-dependent methyltransferase
MIRAIFSWILKIFPRPFLIKASYWARPLLSFWLKGKNFTDPIDGKSYRKFLPYGYGQTRWGVLAPGTLSLERHRLLWLYLKEETSFFTEPINLLHMAPEQAFYSRFKAMKNITYTSADLYSPLAMVQADICALPFKDNSFDVVLCNHVLEHIEDHLKAIEELYRVMKPGGWGVFQIPQDLGRASTFEDASIINPKERAAIFGQYDHVRVYGKDYGDFLEQAGFLFTAIDFTQKLGVEKIMKYRLAKGELIPFVQKPLL